MPTSKPWCAGAIEKKRGRRRGGFTLLEVVVYTGLLGLLLTAIFGVLIGSLHYFFQHAEETEITQGGLTALDRLSLEVVDSHSGSVSIYTSPCGLVFASPRDDRGGITLASDGSLQWRNWVCFYVDGAGERARLVRKERPIDGAPLSSPPPFSTTYTTAWFASQPLPTRIIGPHVSVLSVVNGNSLDVTMTIQGQTLGKDQRLEVRTSLVLRN